MSNDIEDHPTPENVHDCKGWLEESMPRTSTYSETADRAALTTVFNLTLARKAPSFEKLYRDFQRICIEAKAIEQS